MGTKPPSCKNIFRIFLGTLLIGSFLLGIVSAAVVADNAANGQGSLTFSATPTPGTYFDHVVFVIMENHALSSITASTAPYMHSLGVEWANSTHYTIPGSLQPSLPNYLALTGGSSFGITSDCAPTACPVTAPNTVDRLDSGKLTWKAYMEDYPLASGCTTTATSNQYAAKHNPFVYYQDIVNNSTRCQNIRNANSVIVPCCNTETDDLFLADLNATSPANYIWLTPNLCDDMHDCSVGTGNTYLSRLVPKILGSVLFQTSRAALVITFDEAGSGSSAPLYWVGVGPQAKTAYTSNVSYTHYNWLATIESNWSLGCLVSGNDCGAKLMSEFFSAAGPKLVFTTAAPTLTAGVCSGTITVQTQDSFGNPTTVGATVGLSTTSSGGTFSLSSTCIPTVASVTIPAGSSSASFFYTDNVAGTPTISASVAGSTIATQTETVKAIQSSGLQATFTDSPSNPQPGQSISFAGTATGGGSPYAFKWNFGDGSSGTGQTVSHLYQKVGSYTTVLTVTDAVGHVATASHVLTVAATSTSSPGGICLQCLVRTLSLSSLFLIGLAIGLALTASMMALAIRRNRRTIRRLLRQRDALGNRLPF